MKRAAGINYPTGPDKYQIKGIVSDASNGMPIDGVEVDRLWTVDPKPTTHNNDNSIKFGDFIPPAFFTVE